MHLRRYVIDFRDEQDAERVCRQEIVSILLDTYEDAMTSRRIDAWVVAERIRDAGR